MHRPVKTATAKQGEFPTPVHLHVAQCRHLAEAAGGVRHAGKHIVLAGAGADAQVVGQAGGRRLAVAGRVPAQRGHAPGHGGGEAARRGRQRVGRVDGGVPVDEGGILLKHGDVQLAVAVIVAPGGVAGVRGRVGDRVGGQVAGDVGEGVIAVVAVNADRVCPSRPITARTVEQVEPAVVVVVPPLDVDSISIAWQAGIDVGETAVAIVVIDVHTKTIGITGDGKVEVAVVVIIADSDIVMTDVLLHRGAGGEAVNAAAVGAVVVIDCGFSGLYHDDVELAVVVKVAPECM